MSDLDDFFNDPKIGGEAKMRNFDLSKKILILKYKLMKGSPRTAITDANPLILWFKTQKKLLTAYIAAEFIFKLFYDNPSTSNAQTIIDELIIHMEWDPKSPVTSLQRGFASTLKPNKIWLKGWKHSRGYFIHWLSWMISDTTTQLTYQLRNSLPPGTTTSYSKKETSSSTHDILASAIAQILIDDSAGELPSSWKRLKIKRLTQAVNRALKQGLSNWDKSSDLNDFLRKAVGLRPGSSSNTYKNKESRYGLAEDLFQTDAEHKICRGNVLHCAKCKDNKGEFHEMIWPSQICSSCRIPGSAYIIERIWTDNDNRLETPTQICNSCGNPGGNPKKKMYLFVKPEERPIKVTDGSLACCNGGDHEFPYGQGKARHTWVFVKWDDAQRVLLQKMRGGSKNPKEINQNLPIVINEIFGIRNHNEEAVKKLLLVLERSTIDDQLPKL